ncbi:MAG: hypothetical protein BA871_07355 [Desulfuromonadales bacterium C00003096]|nr:MAG: hypothetical protein BA871_07355 [Desulfuromonadales bacterium C00003096]
MLLAVHDSQQLLIFPMIDPILQWLIFLYVILVIQVIQTLLTAGIMLKLLLVRIVGRPIDS